MDYPEPEDEFEAAHQDELELMNELNYGSEDEPYVYAPPFEKEAATSSTTSNQTSKRSLDFSSTSSPTASLAQQQCLHRGDVEHPAKKLRYSPPLPSLETSIKAQSLSSDIPKQFTPDLLTIINAGPGTSDSNDQLPRETRNFNQELPLTYQWPKITKHYVWRNAPCEDSQKVTCSDGKRFYMKMRNLDDIDKEAARIIQQTKIGNLLSVPFSTLKRQAKGLLEKQATVEVDYFEKRLREIEESAVVNNTNKLKETSYSAGGLWVEHYRPRNYVDLLSDELWDKIVFHKDTKLVLKAKEAAKKPKEFPIDNKAKFAKKPGIRELALEVDDEGRPLHKVALLCGPPGLGKTTLAHVVARHAGYNVVEMNASDDRSVEAFRTQLESATRMRSVLSRDPRPNCLVIDEIDGAPAAAIAVLINLIATKDSSYEMEKKTKKKKNSSPLQRPIICICNDLYTPALRTLRQLALVLHCPPTLSSKLAQRLLFISRQQNLETDLSALLALCEQTENDIRCCLSTLYFFRVKGGVFRPKDALNASIGHKDMQKTLFGVWQAIFQIPRAKKRHYVDMTESLNSLSNVESAEEINQPNSYTARYRSILRIVQACGDYERLALGVFENYPTVTFKDSHLQAVCNGLDWICKYDVLQQNIHHHQLYTLMSYLPYHFVGMHFEWGATAWPKVFFPSKQQEMVAKHAQNLNLVCAMRAAMSGEVYAFTAQDVLIQDLLPALTEIVTPDLRPVNLQLYSLEEKETLHTLISIMIAYNLTYRQERSIEGSYNYVLEPNMEEIVRFADIKCERQLSYASRQLVAREIETEKMRRYELALQAHQPASTVVPVNQPLLSVTEPMPSYSSESKLPALKQSKPLSIAPVVQEKPVRDFFGRVIDKPKLCEEGSSTNLRNSGPSSAFGSSVWFHFKEGYSNAVRRSVKVKDFL